MNTSFQPSLIYIYNRETLIGNDYLLTKFVRIYEGAFPDENERENFEYVLKRISDIPPEYEPNTFIILATDPKKEVLYGGIIGDWYKNSEAIHLTYIVVDENVRGKNIGKSLIIDGVNEIRTKIEAEFKISLRNVYFESNNPKETNPDNDSILPLTRLKIFAGLGAKWININYVQPSLDITKSKVKNLFLFTFPELNADGEDLKVKDIINFLTDFYKGLGIKKPEDDPDFSKMVRDLSFEGNEVFQLKDVPVEKNSFHFHKVSVAIHFVENQNSDQLIDEDQFSEAKDNTSPCNSFNSYEKDLLSFQNQKNSPLCSSLLKVKNERELTILFPEVYQYITEGRIEERDSERREVRARFSISSTHYWKAKIKIWHLVLSPGKDEYFTEYDLIKLINIFGSRQECSSIKEQYPVMYDGERIGNFTSFLAKVADVNHEKLEIAGTGILQFDTAEVKKSYGETGFKWSDVYGLLSRIKNERHVLEEPQKTEKDKHIVSFLKVLCGLTLGIFDFNRMGIGEIEDTVYAIEASNSYYTVMSRGTLLCMGEDEEMLKSVYYNIGINPYLLIPSAVLTYNYYHLEKADRILDNHIITKGRISSSEKEETKSFHRKIPIVINNLQLKDIFQYPTEKEIFIVGINQRGIIFLEDKIRLKLADLKSKTDMWDKRAAARSLAYNTMIIAFIPVVAFYSIIKELLINWFGSAEKDAVTYSAIISLVLAIGIAGIAFFITIHQKKHEN